jgi:hypothetical protein
MSKWDCGRKGKIIEKVIEILLEYIMSTDFATVLLWLYIVTVYCE